MYESPILYNNEEVEKWMQEIKLWTNKDVKSDYCYDEFPMKIYADYDKRYRVHIYKVSLGDFLTCGIRPCCLNRLKEICDYGCGGCDA